MKKTAIALFALSFLAACNKAPKLPVLGVPEVKEVKVGDEVRVDTVQFTIPSFEFVNQQNEKVGNAQLAGNIYLADFFFRTCKAICPKMKRQMLRIQEAYQERDDFKMLSHSLDPVKDEVPLLKKYADDLGANGDMWHFVTGDEESIYGIARYGYFVTAMKDDSVPGGINHSGHLVLVDRKGRIRGYYEGTDPKEVDKCIADIALLYEED